MSNARVNRKVKAICRRNGIPYKPLTKWEFDGISLLDQMGSFLHKMGLSRDPLIRPNSGKRWQNHYR